MPLIIKGTIYLLTSDMDKIREAVATLPPPIIVRVDQSRHIKPEEMVLTLQGEMAYVNTSLCLDEIQYIGTKNLSQCLMLYIYNDENHFVVHIDDLSRTLNLNEIIDRFSDKSNLKAVLLGGATFNAMLQEKSEKNLKKILFALACSPVPITLESQKLIQDNVYHPLGSLGYCKDLFISKCKNYFKLMTGKELDPSAYEHLKANDFLNKESSFSSEALHTFATLVSIAEDFISEENAKIIEESKEGFTEKFFKITLTHFFSKQGYPFLLERMLTTAPNVYDTTELRNVIIGLKPGLIYNTPTLIVYQISALTPTPLESRRALALYDWSERGNYHLAFDGKNYRAPSISTTLSDSFPEISQLVKNNHIFNDELLGALKLASHSLDLYHLSVFATAVKNHTKEPSAVTKPLLIRSNQLLSTSHIELNDARAQSALKGLNGCISGTDQFKPYARRFPSGTLDAILKCRSENIARQIQEQLANQSIKTDVRYFYDQGYCVCSLGINKDQRALTEHIPQKKIYL